MRGSKIPVQELWLKMGGRRIREGGGGVIAGFYGICVIVGIAKTNLESAQNVQMFPAHFWYY